MPKTYRDTTFASDYKDDWRDSDNYSRILFNPGRALQARELTQMQTIIQEQMKKFANNIYQKDGVALKTGGIQVHNNMNFIKIAVDTNNAFDDVKTLKGVILTGATNNIKVRINRAVKATTNHPHTLYVTYLDDPNTGTVTNNLRKARKIEPGEVLSNGSNINMTVQTTNTNANRAIGLGSGVSVGKSEFYVNGHFVYVRPQFHFLNKYKKNVSDNIGFKVKQDIITVSDTDKLYDNTNATPNRASPGADRYRLRLVLTRQRRVKEGDTFVYYGRLQSGRLVDKVSADDGFNSVRSFVSKRLYEIHGDFIKKYWKLRVTPNGNSQTHLMLKVDPGTAYLRGRRVATSSTLQIPIKRAQTTEIIGDNEPKEEISIDYGNYYYFDSGVGMLDINTCEAVTLYAGADGADSAIGTANIRAITEGQTSKLVIGDKGTAYNYQRAPKYKAHLFNIFRNNFSHTLQDVKSIKSNTNGHLINLTLANYQNKTNAAILHRPKKGALIFDTPRRRPKAFTEASMTFMKKYDFTASGSTHTITLTDAGETFQRASDTFISDSTQFAPDSASAAIQSNNKDLVLSGLTNGESYEIISFVKKTNSEVRTKELTETTITATMDSDGKGVRYIDLGKSDIYSLSRIRVGDSDGEDIYPNFLFDAGQRASHYGDGRLIHTGGGLDSSMDSDVFVRFKYFAPSANGQFYAVNSYSGLGNTDLKNYSNIPAYTKADGNKVSLRDIIDLRPSTDGSGSFTTVPLLPAPTESISAKAEYYLPRRDVLYITKDGRLELKSGSPERVPKYPEIPDDAMSLYNITLMPNTLHSKDMTSHIIRRKGYTMDDIGKLEKKIDRLEYGVTLSLLELNTKIMKVLDSDGNDRTKIGFFADNFKNHAFSDTKAKDYRASIDKGNNILRPTFVEDVVDLYYDSANTDQLNTTVINDFVMLDYTPVPYDAQDMMSGTENLIGFYPAEPEPEPEPAPEPEPEPAPEPDPDPDPEPQTVGLITLSPETDDWYETDIVGERVVNKETKLDLEHYVNFNNSEQQWYGIDPNTLEVGGVLSQGSMSESHVSHEALDPVLIGSETTTSYGEWVEIDHVVDTIEGETETYEVSRERREEVSRELFDVIEFDEYDTWVGQSYELGYSLWDGNYYSHNGYTTPVEGLGISFANFGGPINVTYSSILYEVYQITTSLYDVITEETRTPTTTTTTTTRERTVTYETENTYQGEAEVTTTTTTTNVVNSIESESFVREIIGNKVIDVAVIPFMRSIDIHFKAEGLRPNTQYYPFFDNTRVGDYCRETAFKTLNQRQWLLAQGTGDDNGTVQVTAEHSDGKTILTTDANGELTGSFQVPNNSKARFQTGQREFALFDINAYDKTAALSYARAMFVASGALETVENEVSVVRTLKVVGEATTEVDVDVASEYSTWTEVLIDEETATDVQSSTTTGVIIGDQTQREEHVGDDITYETEFLEGFIPPDIPEADQGPGETIAEDPGVGAPTIPGGGGSGGRINDDFFTDHH